MIPHFINAKVRRRKDRKDNLTQRGREAETQRVIICMIVLIFLLSACASIVPATVPPQLSYTPGPAAVIGESVYDAGVFYVRYPRGWRVVKMNAAGAPQSVVFISPDGAANISLNTSTATEEVMETRIIPLENGVNVTASLHGSTERFIEVFEAVVDSLRSG